MEFWQGGLSLAIHLYRTSRPHAALVGRVPDSEHFRNIERHRAEVDERLAILCIDESLYFANSRYLEDTVLELLSLASIGASCNHIEPGMPFLRMSGLPSRDREDV
ncbi:hypothetical protein [Modicisalibacter luteus]|uniref:Uncharacterized protein n=1 Tax=Modicisalibacter luteus TaxID=453962 RepID=A0ABV7M541_9GAMM